MENMHFVGYMAASKLCAWSRTRNTPLCLEGVTSVEDVVTAQKTYSSHSNNVEHVIVVDVVIVLLYNLQHRR